MRNRPPIRRIAPFPVVLLSAVLWTSLCAFREPPPEPDGGRELRATVRLDGKFVHNVGRLHLQMTNIGETGNQDNPRRTTVPSAEWPPGSGIEYLYAAGPWIGALDASGIPHVTTALYDRELSPEFLPEGACARLPADQVADIREAYEGIPGGNRVISSSLDPDDDGDGLVDEDFLNGLDDDGDGRCDEDYSAVGQQMFATEYVDYLTQTRQANPEHVPLGIRIRQTSYAWATPGQNDFVGIDYQIVNESGRALRNVYVGVFADCDIGSRAYGDARYTDDQAGLIDSVVSYVGPTGQEVRRRIQMGYMWDNPDNPARAHENKGGDAPGFIGCMFLNHTTDPAGLTAPTRVGITSFRFFSGSAPYPAGDPENDAQRYQLMSDPMLRPELTGPVVTTRPLDYRFVMATGPFQQILPDSSLTISVAYVLGDGRGPSGVGGTLIENAVAVQQVFDGIYADLDGNALTGACGKETCLRNTQPGSRFVYTIPDTSLCRVRFHTAVDPERYPDVPSWDPDVPCGVQQDGRYVCPDVLGGSIENGGAHCASADTLDLLVASTECTYVDLDCDVLTGQGGREQPVHWVAAAALPSPRYQGQDGRAEVEDFLGIYRTREDSARVSAWFFPGDRKVTLKWSNFAELVRDAQRGNLKEFVGYRIYKAAGWKRPLGTNAPATNLWQLLGEWRTDAQGTPAHPLAGLIDPAAPAVSTSQVTVRWDPARREVRSDVSHVEVDTLFALGRYSYVDTRVLNGFPYFYSIVPLSIVPGDTPERDLLLMGSPGASNAEVVYPRADAQRDQERVYVVPNPYRGGAAWDLVPREEDPSGTKVTFVNLPRTRGVIRIYTLAGDLVKEVPFRGSAAPDLQYGKDPVTTGSGSATWNLISRNGQRIVSGVYLYSVDSELGRQVGRFIVIR